MTENEDVKRMSTSLSLNILIKDRLKAIKKDLNKSESYFVDSALQSYLGGVYDETWIHMYMPTKHAAFTEVMNRMYKEVSPSKPTSFPKVLLEIDNTIGSLSFVDVSSPYKMDSWAAEHARPLSGMHRVGFFYCYERYKAAMLHGYFKVVGPAR